MDFEKCLQSEFKDLKLVLEIDGERHEILPLKVFNKGIHQTISFIVGSPMASKLRELLEKKRKLESKMLRDYINRKFSIDSYFRKEGNKITVYGNSYDYSDNPELLKLDVDILQKISGRYLGLT